MRTTLHLDGALLRDAKKRAALEGTSLAEVVQQALQVYLAAPAGSPSPRRIRLSVNHARLGGRRSR